MPTDHEHAQFPLVTAYILTTANVLISGLSNSFGKIAMIRDMIVTSIFLLGL